MTDDRTKEEQKQDRVVEESFPASDPPSNTGITGPGTTDKKPSPAEADETKPER